MICILIAFVLFLVLWIGGYCDGRWFSGANAKLSYKLFRQMHAKFPQKWKFDCNYASFYYEIPKDNEQYPSKEFRGYFGPVDLLKYWYYHSEYDRGLKEERAARDYADVIKAFEELEKKVQ